MELKGFIAHTIKDVVGGRIRKTELRGHTKRPQFSHHADTQHRCDLLRGYQEVAGNQRLPLLCAVGMLKIKVVLYRGFTFFHIFTPFFGEKDPNGDLISHRCDPRPSSGGSPIRTPTETKH